MSQKRWTARSLAFEIIGAVLEEEKFASVQLNQTLSKKPLGPRDRALLTHLVYGVIKEKEFLDKVLENYIQFHKTSDDQKNLLRLGSYQILLSEKIPEHAAVYESVELAKKTSGGRAPSFINAVLRKVISQKEDILNNRRRVIKELQNAKVWDKKLIHEASWCLSYPQWILERWSTQFSTKKVMEWALRFNEVAPVYIRANLLKGTPPKIFENMTREGLKIIPVEPGPMALLERGSADILNKFLEEGLVSVQDLASYRVVEFLNPQKGEIGLDVCAGHGGKSSAIQEKIGAEEKFFVHDPSDKRNMELRENFLRLGLPLPDVLSTPDSLAEPAPMFDWLLVDAPCSGMGTLGRKPEIRWRLKQKDIARFAKMQASIMEEWLPRLKIGGRLLYSVCSLEPEEGREGVDRFLEKHPELKETGVFESFSGKETQDGFFCLRMKKISK